MKEMQETTRIQRRRICSGGTNPLDRDFNLQRLQMIEAIKTMGGVCHTGIITTSRGETMEIYLGTEMGRITDANFLTNGCHFCIFSGYIASKLAIGKTADEALEIDKGDILGNLGQIPQSKQHCTHLAAEALHAAVHRWIYSERGRNAREVENEKQQAK